MVVDTISVDVIYALPDDCVILTVKLPKGSSVREAIRLSRIEAKFPDINLEIQKVGAYGKLVDLDSSVKEGDRIEIYRPITVDPKEIRRLRAKKASLAGRAKST